MKQLLIYISGDAYSHQLKFHKQYIITVDEELQMYVSQWKESLREKAISALCLLCLDLSPEEGKVEVILSEYGTNPLKTRLEINTPVLDKQKGVNLTKTYDWGDLAAQQNQAPVQMVNLDE